MSEKIKPCRCGYEGEVPGMKKGPFLSLTCPDCKSVVEAFTVAGLVEGWNAAADTPKGAGDDAAENEPPCSACFQVGCNGECDGDGAMGGLNDEN